MTPLRRAHFWLALLILTVGLGVILLATSTSPDGPPHPIESLR